MSARTEKADLLGAGQSLQQLILDTTKGFHLRFINWNPFA
jgi:hypothetical protein